MLNYDYFFNELFKLHYKKIINFNNDELTDEQFEVRRAYIVGQIKALKRVMRELFTPEEVAHIDDSARDYAKKMYSESVKYTTIENGVSISYI